jgi:hypothetical protein
MNFVEADFCAHDGHIAHVDDVEDKVQNRIGKGSDAKSATAHGHPLQPFARPKETDKRADGDRDDHQPRRHFARGVQQVHRLDRAASKARQHGERRKRQQGPKAKAVVEEGHLAFS